MKKLFTSLLVMLFTLSLVAQDVILITPDNRDDAQYEFLMRQGFNVAKFWPGALSAAGQDTIDMLNAADLIIVGRSPGSGNFDSPDKEFWNALTVPMILNTQWAARSNRLNMFESTSCYHQNYWPNVAYGNVMLPADPIFTYASLDGDSMGWCLPPHDFVQNSDSATNGTIVAMYDQTTPLLIRWEAGTEYYPGAVDITVAPKTYFGFGNDDLVNLGVEEVPNFFPLTRDGKAVYLGEICRMMGIPVQPPVFGAEDVRVMLYTDYAADEESNGYADDDEQYNWLVKQGLYVTKFYAGNALSAAGQDTIDKMNMTVDVVIVGRSCSSGTFDGDDQPVWTALTVPLIVNSQWVARSNRIGMINSTSASHGNDGPPTVYGNVLVPTDPIFADVTLDGDSLGWMLPPHDYVGGADSATNGSILVAAMGQYPLVITWDAGTEYYPGSGVIPAGPRTYFGFGNDDLRNLGVEEFPNNFPLTRDAKQVYLAEVCMMAGLDAAQVPAAVFSAADYSITFITDDDEDDPQIHWLKKNNVRVTKFFPGSSLAAAGQDTIDMLNASELIIIGRSPNSGEFDGDDEPVWNALTAPLILNSQWVARSSRIKMFNSTSAYHLNDGPEVAYATTDLPDDVVFSNLSLMEGDSIGFSLPPHDFIQNNDSLNNGTFVAMFDVTSPLLVRWDAGTEYYPEAGATPAGPRTYFGIGNDNVFASNFFPLTDDGQQLYFNEISRILGTELSEVMTVTADAYLDELTYDISTAILTPEFNDETMDYSLQLVKDSAVVELMATASSDMASIVGDSVIDCSLGDTITTNIVVTAENGNQMSYSVTVYPFVDPLGIESDKEALSAEIRLYPNPATDMMYVESDMEIRQVSVYNVVGKLVMDMSGLLDRRVELNVNALTPGMYMIRVDIGNETSMTKFLKR